MKTISIPPQSKALNDLVKKARRSSVILKASNGEQFVLARVTNMQSFYVGASDNFDEELEATRKNKRLMKFLGERTRKAKGLKGIPIATVRKRLGLS